MKGKYNSASFKLFVRFVVNALILKGRYNTSYLKKYDWINTLSGIIAGNRIRIIGEGELVEEGSHKELIEKKGRYYDLWEAQRYIDEGVG